MINKTNSHVFISTDEYEARRNTLLANMQPNSIAIILAAPEVTRSNDTEYHFRQNSDFFYLTGFEEPDAILVLSNQSETSANQFFINACGDNSASAIFVRPKDEIAEVWHGRRLGKIDAPTSLKIDVAFNLEELPELLPELINGHECLYYEHGHHPKADASIAQAIQACKHSPKQVKTAPKATVDVSQLLHSMRLVKSSKEINVMRASANIACEAHKQAMKMSAEGVYEYQLEAQILYCFALYGARHAAYNTIVGSGENACILHYTENKDELKNGNLVLIDAGAEYNGYASDITRTFPVNGQFSSAQKDIYELVLDIQKQCIKRFKPGVTIAQVMLFAVEETIKGLLSLNILSGTLEECIEKEVHKQYFMHGLGHYLGIDVHDVGNYKEAGQDKPLEPGIVITVEPGIYISSSSEAPEKYHGIGVRIEDNIVITNEGCEVLTDNAPKEVKDIEAIMKQPLNLDIPKLF